MKQSRGSPFPALQTDPLGTSVEEDDGESFSICDGLVPVTFEHPTTGVALDSVVRVDTGANLTAIPRSVVRLRVDVVLNVFNRQMN